MADYIFSRVVMNGFNTFRETKMKDFLVGERILATWADGRKYPAKVNAVLGNGKRPNLNYVRVKETDCSPHYSFDVSYFWQDIF